MKVLTTILLVAIIVPTVQFYRQRSTIRRQQNQIANLQAQVLEASSLKAPPLEYQEKCAEQSKKFFAEMGYKPKDGAVYESHYNAKLNRCFVKVENSAATTHPPFFGTYRSVVDAYEGKSYGHYGWHTVEGKKYWEVPPFMCKVVLLSGEEKSCNSDDEFSELVKVYMEDR